MSGEEDDKPTVVIDLNALKKAKQKQEEDLAALASTLEFGVNTDPGIDLEKATAVSEEKASYRVLLFDFGGTLFKQSLGQFPEGPDYKVLNTLPELNEYLKQKQFQILVFNFDINPKAINQLCAQVRAKFTHIKTVIVAKNLSPEKVKLHGQSPAGAAAYVKLPLNKEELATQFDELHNKSAS